jgi:hypothetical protein
MSQSFVNPRLLVAAILGAGSMSSALDSSINMARVKIHKIKRTNFGFGHNDRMLRRPHQSEREKARRQRQGGPGPQQWKTAHFRYDGSSSIKIPALWERVGPTEFVPVEAV